MRFPFAKTLCLLALVACAPLARAHIYHCIGAHGEQVFSGEPCGTPVPWDSHTGALRTPVPGDSHARSSQRTGNVCADSPQALRHAISDAFATDNVNLFTGLILWRGVGPRATRARLRSLVKWLQQPLVGIGPAYATGPPYIAASPGYPPAGTSAETPPPAGFAISTAGGTRNFGIRDAGRCWWLTF